MIRKIVFYFPSEVITFRVGDNDVTSINLITEGDSKMASVVMLDGTVVEFRNTPYWLERV